MGKKSQLWRSALAAAVIWSDSSKSADACGLLKQHSLPLLVPPNLFC
jgi:hypothetical protein